MNYRQKTLDLLLQVLGDPSTGFNAQYDSLRVGYGAPACAINWTLPSENLILGAVDPELLELLRIESWPAIIIATEEATKTDAVKFSQWSGDVIVNVDAYIRLRAVDDLAASLTAIDLSGNFEKHVNCFEEAAMTALQAGKSAFQAGGCNWVQMQSNRSPVGVLADGYTQRATLTLGFRIHI
jgi:hypothetical protein